jgi:hypothetical protein
VNRRRDGQLRTVGAVLGNHGEHLFDEERIALGGLRDPRSSPLIQLEAAEQHQLLALPLRERLEHDGADI